MDSKPFIVMDNGRCFRFSRGKKMYIVEGVDIRGVTTQGRTFEAALKNAHDAADLMEAFHAEEEVPPVKNPKNRSRRAAAGRPRRVRSLAEN